MWKYIGLHVNMFVDNIFIPSMEFICTYWSFVDFSTCDFRDYFSSVCLHKQGQYMPCVRNPEKCLWTIYSFRLWNLFVHIDLLWIFLPVISVITFHQFVYINKDNTCLAYGTLKSVCGQYIHSVYGIYLYMYIDLLWIFLPVISVITFHQFVYINKDNTCLAYGTLKSSHVRLAILFITTIYELSHFENSFWREVRNSSNLAWLPGQLRDM